MPREDLKTHIRDYRTILTFMTRMTKKGWLEVEKEGDTNYYKPAVDEGHALPDLLPLADRLRSALLAARAGELIWLEE